MDVAATPISSASPLIVTAPPPCRSIRPAAASRIVCALTGSVNCLTSCHPLRLRQVDIAFEIAVQIDDAPLLVGQRPVRESGWAKPTRKSAQPRNLLWETQPRLSFVCGHPDIGGPAPRRA